MQLPKALVLAFATLAAGARSNKRGLVYVPNSQWPQDDQIWVKPNAGLTWYYNYQSRPSAPYASISQDKFEFVPMIWGPVKGTEFLNNITQQLDAGLKIKHVLGFNEPDGPMEYGGSSMAPRLAAEVWVKNVEPLAARGIKLGLPACTGAPTGLPWMKQFLANCSDILSAGGPRKNCTYHFANLHWYGNFEGMASLMGQYSADFPNVSQWITEYNFDRQDLETTQEFFNMSAEYFDRMESVERYSWFGSFRSKVSNVGPYAVMLSNGGQLTDIGSWYLGGNATGVLPTSTSGGVSGRPMLCSAMVGVVALVTGLQLM